MYFCLQLINPVFVDFSFLNEIFYYNSKNNTNYRQAFCGVFFAVLFPSYNKGNYFQLFSIKISFQHNWPFMLTKMQKKKLKGKTSWNLDTHIHNHCNLIVKTPDHLLTNTQPVSLSWLSCTIWFSFHKDTWFEILKLKKKWVISFIILEATCSLPVSHCSS